LGILHAVFFNQLHRYSNYCDMVPYQSCHLMIRTCWWLGWLKWLQTTQRTTWWTSCDDPDNHWWRFCDDRSDVLKTTLTTHKTSGDYLVTTLLKTWWWPLKIWWWHLMTFDDPNWQLSSLKSKVACLADLVGKLDTAWIQSFGSYRINQCKRLSHYKSGGSRNDDICSFQWYGHPVDTKTLINWLSSK
jgi:hypothetical protein